MSIPSAPQLQHARWQARMALLSRREAACNCAIVRLCHEDVEEEKPRASAMPALEPIRVFPRLWFRSSGPTASRLYLLHSNALTSTNMQSRPSLLLKRKTSGQIGPGMATSPETAFKPVPLQLHGLRRSTTSTTVRQTVAECHAPSVETTVHVLR